MFFRLDLKVQSFLILADFMLATPWLLVFLLVVGIAISLATYLFSLGISDLEIIFSTLASGTAFLLFLVSFQIYNVNTKMNRVVDGELSLE